MCGRYSLKKDPRDWLRDYFPGIQFDPDLTFTPNEDVRPTQLSPAVLSNASGSFCTLLQWGLIPAWAPEFSPRYSFINARSESVSEKPAFKSSFRRKRCVIPADSFYEWHRPHSGPKIPYRFGLPHQPFLLFAGIWDAYEGPKGVIQSYALLTTSANGSMAPTHDRMPVLLEKKSALLWLKPGEDTDELQSLFLPDHQPLLTREPVSPNVFRKDPRDGDSQLNLFSP